jgi:hypothetical protein
MFIESKSKRPSPTDGLHSNQSSIVWQVEIAVRQNRFERTVWLVAQIDGTIFHRRVLPHFCEMDGQQVHSKNVLTGLSRCNKRHPVAQGAQGHAAHFATSTTPEHLVEQE